jgi:probable rRNA maturation factor
MDDSEPNQSTLDEPPSASGRVCVDLVDRTGRLDAQDGLWVAAHAERSMDLLGLRGEMNIAVIDDAAMTAAHVRTLGVDGTTDVLTFDHADAPGGTDARVDVEVLVCIDEAARQAEAGGHAVREELLLYVVHGLLHVSGHDDTDAASSEAMHAEEDRILTTIGVGPVYSRASRASRGGRAVP